MERAEALALRDEIRYCLLNSAMKDAVDIAFDALEKQMEKAPALKVICGITGTACTNCKWGPCEARRMGVPNETTDI